MERVRSFLDGPWEKSYDPMALLRMRERCREYAVLPKGWLLLSGQSG